MPTRLDGEKVAAAMVERGLIPLEPYPGAVIPWRVRCADCGAVSTPKWSKVQARGDGCKPCGMKRSADAKRISPQDAADLATSLGYEPLESYSGSKTPWRMTHVVCGREVTPKLDNLRNQGGCVECGKWQAAASRKGAKAEGAIEEMRAAGLEPLTDYPGTKASWLVRCGTCGHEGPTSINTVRAGGYGCASCANTAKQAARRTPVEDAAALLASVGLTMTGEFRNFNSVVACTCDLCGQPTTFSLASATVRIQKDPGSPARGCETCVFTASGESRRISQEAALERLTALGMTALGPYPGALEGWPATCNTCGSLNRVLLSKSHGKGWACSACALKASADAMRKPQDVAVEEARNYGFEPVEEYRSLNAPWRMIHLDCGNEVTPRLASLRKQSGCSHCAKTGFDATSAAVLYVLESDSHDAVKVGITTANGVSGHMRTKRDGWRLVKSWEFPVGAQARDIERAVLAWWRDELDAPVFLTAAEMGRRGGWTETAERRRVSAEETVTFIHRAMRESR